TSRRAHSYEGGQNLRARAPHIIQQPSTFGEEILNKFNSATKHLAMGDVTQRKHELGCDPVLPPDWRAGEIFPRCPFEPQMPLLCSSRLTGGFACASAGKMLRPCGLRLSAPGDRPLATR